MSVKTSVPVGPVSVEHSKPLKTCRLCLVKQYFSNTLQFYIIKTHRSSNTRRMYLLTAKAQFPVLIPHPVITHECSPVPLKNPLSNMHIQVTSL